MAHSYTECLRSEAAIRLRAILTFPSRARKLGGTETGAMTDLDPGLFRTRGRASAALTAVAVRALQVDDLVLLQGEKGSRAPPLKRLAERHHALARCLASGMSPGDAAVTCGYDQSRVSILQADPAFRELLTFYRDDVNRSYRDMHERLAGLSLDATALLQEQLEADLSAEPDERKLSTVNVKPRSYAQVMKKHWYKTPYKGVVGCPQVPASYWLVRENGFISVTGNTNLQNVTSSLRSMFVADPGMMFCNIDLEQADARNVGALCWNLLIDNGDWDEKSAGAFLDACESGDLHTYVTKLAFPHLPWGTAPDREIAERPAHKHYDYRYLSKKCGHGSNYLAQPATVAKHARIPLKFAKDFQKQYFEAFPCIPAWHESVFHQLDTIGFLTSPFGWRRFFFGRPREAATRREAVAAVPQNMTGHEINTGILKLWRADKVQLLVQVHDSILFQFPEHLRDEIVPWAIEEIKTELTLAHGRKFVVPTDAETGWNWGKASDDNPDGLKKWRGTDDRKRTETSFQLSLSDFSCHDKQKTSPTPSCDILKAAVHLRFSASGQRSFSSPPSSSGSVG